jgi:transcriptional regulator with XRE-family HTH domain
MPRFDGALLRDRRKYLGLTRPELAQLSTVGYGTILNLERGKIRPSITTLEKLCDGMSCNPDTFFAACPDDDIDPRPTDLGPGADAWVARTLATAPPLTTRQAKRISEVLFGRVP